MVTNVQRNVHDGEEVRTAAKEALEVRKTNLEMTRHMKNTGQQKNRTIIYSVPNGWYYEPLRLRFTKVIVGGYGEGFE